MPRPQLHTTDAMLDAARELLLEQGAASATIEAIASRSGAPTGSIYHRFGSRNELIASVWIRAVRRSQEAWVRGIEVEDPRAAAIGAATALIGFCREQPADAQLLVAFRRDDLIETVTGSPLASELAALNKPVEGAVVDLARRLYGNRRRASLDRVMLIVFDIPYGAARRYLLTGRALPRGLDDDVARALTAVLDAEAG